MPTNRAREKAYQRKLNALGLKSFRGWVRKEDAPAVQELIDKAKPQVEEAMKDGKRNNDPE